MENGRHDRPSDVDLSDVLDMFGWKLVGNVGGKTSFHVVCGGNVVAFTETETADSDFGFATVNFLGPTEDAERRLSEIMTSGFVAYQTTMDEANTSIFPEAVPGTRTWEFHRVGGLDELAMRVMVAGCGREMA